MQYTDKDNNPVQIEKWCWIVFYSDGSHLKQFDENGRYHYFAEIDQSKATRFGLYDQTGKLFYRQIPAGAKLIHYYDNIIQQPQAGGTVHHRLYCFGYELGKEKKIWSVLPTNVLVEGIINNLEII